MKQTIAEISVQYQPINAEKPKVNRSSDAQKIFREFFPIETIQLQEYFMVMYLNRANKVLGVYQVSTGGITSTTADIRLILGVALKTASTAMVLAHNHPSGNTQPSKADIALTAQIKEAAKYMDIIVLDHIILTQNDGFYSFADEGVL